MLEKSLLDSKALPTFQKEALKWYRNAASQDYAPAQTRLAVIYYYGAEGVEKNVEMCLRLALEAAQVGESFAAYVLGTEFVKGQADFTPQDYQESYYWYNLALKNKESLDETIRMGAAGTALNDLSELRDEVGKNLGEEQRRKIQERVDSWKPKNHISSGTGFYIDKNYILTNAHVVTWKDFDGKLHEYNEYRIPYRRVKLIATDQDVDLALLYDERGNTDAATFRSAPVDVGEDIALFGYPLSGVLSYRGNGTPGFVSGLSDIISVSRPDDLFQHTAPQQNGNSGGPVFDSKGNAVGVSVSNLISNITVKGDSAPQRIKINPPQNVNFAIKFDVIDQFLRNNKITVDTVTKLKNTENLNTIDLQKLYDKAKKFTVPVLCFKNKAPEPLPVVEIKIVDLTGKD